MDMLRRLISRRIIIIIIIIIKASKAESLLAFQRTIKAAKFPPLTVSGKLSVCDVYCIEQDSKYFPPEDWMSKAAEGDNPPGDGFRRE